MKSFTQLYKALDRTTKTNEKVQALVGYFETAHDKDKLWAIALFTHKRPRRTVSTSLLRVWAAELAQIPGWLFEETYHIVGDLAETIAKVLPSSPTIFEKPLHQWIENIQGLKNKDEEEKRAFVTFAWNNLGTDERFLFNKLITGGFRIGVSQKLVTKALSKYLEVDENRIAHRLMGNWDANVVEFDDLLRSENALDDASKPYPFYLAYALDNEVASLGNPEDWAAEWKWDGIRGQLIVREQNVFIWSRGEELVTDSYPEFSYLSELNQLSFVIDGEILAYKDELPMDFQFLQKRISKKKVTKKLISEVPVVIMAYDLLELNRVDLRQESYKERRQQLTLVIKQLEKHLSQQSIILSKEIKFNNWIQLTDQRKEARSLKTEGFMLKMKTSTYKTGRKKGEWWKWKIDPFTIDAVMIYAMRGHGRRTNLYSDFTFAVWKDERLVPVTKAYSGLTDKEFKEITNFVKKNTIERFGPVSSVKPTLVFEIAFEGISRSTRHKSGVALRFPRIKHWRRDKPASEANTLQDLEALL